MRYGMYDCNNVLHIITLPRRQCYILLLLYYYLSRQPLFFLSNYFSLRGIKNSLRPVLRPTEYTQFFLKYPAKPLQRSFGKNSVWREFRYILENITKAIYELKKKKDIC